MKFKDFQAPVLFSSTFKALNLGEKNSSTFEYFQECVGSLPTVCSLCWWNNQFAGGRRLDMSARDKLAACAVQARWWSLDALYKYWLVPLVPKSTLKNYAQVIGIPFQRWSRLTINICFVISWKNSNKSISVKWFTVCSKMLNAENRCKTKLGLPVRDGD